ncbi:MAG TPA: hypothetical protein VLH60_07745 [Sedimentisphaerales bacterium]|nr:hypothetical protein [Sedimentisphaerales bacterium]
MPVKIDKQRILFILLPACIAIWPLWLAFAALPAAKQDWENDSKKLATAREVARNILTLDPDRLQNVDAAGRRERFEYPFAINRIASISGISPANYRLTVLANVRPTTGQATQNAMVTLSRVPIQTAAEFVSIGEMQYYPNLKCVQLNLTRIRDQRNLWEVNLTFTHYE